MMNKEVKELAKEWLEKAIRKDESELEKEMDKFVNLYIAYNALYKESSMILSEGNEKGLKSSRDKISKTIERLQNDMYSAVQGIDDCKNVKKTISDNLREIEKLKEEKKEKKDKLTKQIQTHDKVSATKNIPKFLGQEKLYSLLIKEEDKINVLLKVIEKKTFYFSTKSDNKTADFEKDKELHRKIKSKFKEKGEDTQQEFNESLLSLIYATRCNMFHGQKNPKYQTLDIFNAMNSILERVIGEILDNH